MTPRVYRSIYFWTDEAELRRAFALAPSSAPTVVDVAAGPNTAPAAVLASQAPASGYQNLRVGYVDGLLGSRRQLQ